MSTLENLISNLPNWIYSKLSVNGQANKKDINLYERLGTKFLKYYEFNFRFSKENEEICVDIERNYSDSIPLSVAELESIYQTNPNQGLIKPSKKVLHGKSGSRITFKVDKDISTNKEPEKIFYEQFKKIISYLLQR